MASVRCEIVITAPPELVWDVLRDVGAVHQRLAYSVVQAPGLRPGITTPRSRSARKAPMRPG